MTTYDLGDGVNLDHFVYDRDDQLTNATVNIAITRPAGTTFTAPSITNPATGTYRAATFVPDVTGPWSGAWIISGAVTDVVPFGFYVADPGPQPYVSLPDMKAWLKLDAGDTADDSLIADALASVSTEIDDVCERTFNRTLVVSTRTFEPVGRDLVLFDDIHSLEGLVITVDGTAWASEAYSLKPINGIVNGQPRPYSRLEARAGYCLALGWASVSFTTKHWGWATVPAPVHESCKIATADTLGLKDARFGVAGFGQYGDIRVRDNVMVMKKLKPYMRNPVKVA